MRKAIIKEYDKLADKLANFVAALNYRFMELCVKAEPVALLNVSPMIDGKVTKLEECAKVAKPDDYSFMVIPDFDEDLPAVQKSIFRAHPEFKMAIEIIKVDSMDEEGNPEEVDARYLRLTMPEVNDERYDVLKDGAKLLYEECKAQMEAANTMSKGKFAELATDETKENVERLDKALKKLNEQWDTKRDSLYQAKLDEIDKAYNKWLAGQAQQEIAKMEEDDARGTTTGIRLSDMHEY